MSTVIEAIAADRRLAILRLLSASCGISHSGVLGCALRHLHPYADGAMIRGDLSWLEGRGLIALAPPSPGQPDVHLTPRGGRAALGTETVEGIARP